MSINENSFLLMFHNDINKCLVKFHQSFALLVRYRHHFRDICLNCKCDQNIGNQLKNTCIQLENECNDLFNIEQNATTNDLTVNSSQPNHNDIDLIVQQSVDHNDSDISIVDHNDSGISIEVVKQHKTIKKERIKKEKRDLSYEKYDKSLNNTIINDSKDIIVNCKVENSGVNCKVEKINCREENDNDLINECYEPNKTIMQTCNDNECVNQIIEEHNHNTRNNQNSTKLNNANKSYATENQITSFGNSLATKQVFKDHIMDYDAIDRFTTMPYVRMVISRKPQSFNKHIGYCCKYKNCDFIVESLNAVLKHMIDKHKYDSSKPRRRQTVRQPLKQHRINRNDNNYDKMKPHSNRYHKTKYQSIKSKSRYKNKGRIMFNGYTIGIDTQELFSDDNQYLSMIRSKINGKLIGYLCKWPNCDVIMRKKSAVLEHCNLDHKCYSNSEPHLKHNHTNRNNIR